MLQHFLIKISVKSGMGSEDVAALLQENGIVANAEEFDSFLCANGYDAQVRVGDFTFKKGMTQEEVAKVLTTEGE